MRENDSNKSFSRIFRKICDRRLFIVLLPDKIESEPMATAYPSTLKSIVAHGLHVITMVAFFLLFALVYEPRLLSDLLHSGQGLYSIRDMEAFNLAISCAVIFVSMFTLRIIMLLINRHVTTTLERYAVWCVIESLITSALLALYFKLISGNGSDAGNYFYFLISCLKAYISVVVFPYVILTLFFLHMESRKAKNEPMEDDAKIRFYDNRHLLRFATTVSSIVYIAAEENYIIVHYVDNGVAKTATIRNTMKSQESICDSGTFIRVHRSYIVNPKHVKQLRKDPDGFYFADMDAEGAAIPVSKRYLKSIDALL